MYIKERKLVFVCIFWLCTVYSVSAQSAFQRGEELFMQNRPMEAVVLLENALTQEPRNERIYLYLGISYEQIGSYDKAIAILQKGLEVAVLNKDQLYFNMGNNYAAKGDNNKAREMYSKALEVKNTFSDAYLNRANVAVKLDSLDEAVRDYRLYLAMEPLAGRDRRSKR